MELWKKIKGFSDYEISSYGNIKSLERTKKFKNGRVVHFSSKKKTQRIHPGNGFLMSDLIDDLGKKKTIYPHKLVASMFIKNAKPRKNKVVIHLDGNLQNNKVENLKWSSYSESIKMTKLEKLFKLVGHINVSNLVAFNENNKIVKYNNINEILVSYINVRLNYYVKRKEYLLGMLQSNISLLEVKVRFINEFIENTIIINNRSKQNIIEQLETGKYPLLDSISYNNNSINNNDNDTNKDTISNELSLPESNNKYDYLLKMPIYNLTKDKIDEFNTQLADRKMEYNILENKNQTQLWDDDLMVLKQTCFKDTTKFKAKKHVLKLKNKAT